ncbi:T9SS type A sorting domain-containing protein [bacterium]|nr:T9SS type A sorting domain-containing protein [bacterium]RQV97972.1 MAG: T9SS C-terminal target domain-containing protein [bacterium]
MKNLNRQKRINIGIMCLLISLLTGSIYSGLYAQEVFIKDFEDFPAYPYNTEQYKVNGAFIGCGPTTGAMIMAYFDHVNHLVPQYGLLMDPEGEEDEGLFTAQILGREQYMNTRDSGFGRQDSIKTGLEGYAFNQKYRIKVTIHCAEKYTDPTADYADWLNEYGSYGDAWINDGYFWHYDNMGRLNINSDDFCDFIHDKLSEGVPIFLTIDTNMDREGDHWVPCIGFNKALGKYAYYDTYSTSVKWADIHYARGTGILTDNSIIMVRSVRYLGRLDVVDHFLYGEGQWVCPDHFSSLYYDLDGDGTYDTQVVFRTLTGMARWLPTAYPYDNRYDFMYQVGTGGVCHGQLDEDRGRFVIHFIDMLASGWEWNNSASWTYKRISSLSVDVHNTYTVRPALSNNAGVICVEAYQNRYQTNPIEGVSWHWPEDEYEDWRYKFSDEIGIEELYVSTDFETNHLDRLILGNIKPNTYEGTDVEVDAGNGVTVGFDEITESGNTTATASDCNIVPPNSYAILPLDNPVYYDIETTATYSGNITICVHYDDTGLSPAQEAELKFMYYKVPPGEWEEIPIISLDTDANIICGETNHLSQFAVICPINIPAVPTNLAAHSIPEQIHVTWEDHSDDEDGFVLEKKVTPGAFPIVWEVVDTLMENRTSYQIDDPGGNFTYYFRVYAFNEFGNSDYSDQTSISTGISLTYLKITSPNGDEIWNIGSNREITWTNSTMHPPSKVNILLSTDAGSNWLESPIASDIANTGSYSWIVSDVPSTECLIKIEDASDGLPYDLSNHPFTICSSPLVPASPSDLEAHLLPGQVHLTWEDNSDDEDGFVIQKKYLPCIISENYWHTIDTLNSDVTSYQTDAPASLNQTFYFRVFAFNEYGNSAYSNTDEVKGNLLLVSITIESPNGGEEWTPGSSQDITWSSFWSTSAYKIDQVTIRYSTDGGSHWVVPPIASIIENTGSYSWTVPNTASDQCLIKIEDASDGNPYDLSNEPFLIKDGGGGEETDVILEVPMAGIAPVIDGQMDPVWYSVCSVLMEKQNVTDEVAPDDWLDNFASFKMMYDSDYYYLFIQAYDDVINTSNSLAWENDSFEIFFDGDNSKNDLSTGYDDNDTQLRYIHGQTSDNLDSAPNSDCMFKNSDNGYNFEVRIPAQDMTFNLTPDQTFGFDIQFNDNDSGGRDHLLKWWSESDHSWHNPSLFGTARTTDYVAAYPTNILRTSTAPVIDGLAEKMVWDDIPWLSDNTFVTHSGGSALNPPFEVSFVDDCNDCRFNYKLTWEGSMLYLYVNVFDDMISTDHADCWMNDGIQIFIDGHNDKTTSTDANDAEFDPVYNTTPTSNLAFTQTGSGWTMEAEWDLSVNPGITPDIGDLMGFDIQLNDNDGGGRDIWSRWWSDDDKAGSNPSVFGTVRFAGLIVDVDEQEEAFIQSFQLTQNYPNPFNPETTIRFDVKEPCRVVLKVYNIMGQEMINLVDRDYHPGMYKVQFNANGFSPGIYFYRIQMGNFRSVKKMVILE